MRAGDGDHRAGLGAGHGRQRGAVSRTVRIRAEANGHYFVDAETDGTPVRFMVDTGATR